MLLFLNKVTVLFVGFSYSKLPAENFDLFLVHLYSIHIDKGFLSVKDK